MRGARVWDFYVRILEFGVGVRDECGVSRWEFGVEDRKRSGRVNTEARTGGPVRSSGRTALAFELRTSPSSRAGTSPVPTLSLVGACLVRPRPGRFGPPSPAAPLFRRRSKRSGAVILITEDSEVTGGRRAGRVTQDSCAPSFNLCALRVPGWGARCARGSRLRQGYGGRVEFGVLGLGLKTECEVAA